MTSLLEDTQGQRPSPTDEFLIDRYRKTGSQADRDEVVLRYVPGARQLAVRCMHGRRYRNGDERDAEEIANEAVMEALSGFEPALGVPFSAFVDTVVKRRVENCVRDLQRDDAHFNHGRPVEDTLEHVQEVFPASARPGADPAKLAEEHEQKARLDQAVKELPRQFRIVMQARRAGMSLRRLAEQWGKPYPTVRELNREAFDRLKRKLRPLDEEK